MEEKYRGDTFIFPFGFEDENLQFEVGDVLKVGVKKACDCKGHILYKEITVNEATEEIQVRFEASETKNIAPGEYEIEAELTKNNIVETCYRSKLKVIGDIV